MKARGGYSLIEVVVVIGILSTLAVIGTVNFRKYLERYRVEAQTRMLYQELLKARSDALYRRREIRLRIYPERFELYSSNDVGVAPLRTLPLSFTLRCKGEEEGGGGVTVVFDSRGVAEKGCSICLDRESDSPVDSVVVYKTRVRIGKNEDPSVCDSDYIKTK